MSEKILNFSLSKELIGMFPSNLKQQQPYPTHLVLPQQQGNARKAKVFKSEPVSLLGALQVQPNPADQWLAFTVGELQGLPESCSIQISSSSGVVLNEIKLNSGKGQYLLDTRGYADGVYFYRVIGSKEAITGKFVVQHEN
jgi:hypothetical protein